MTSEERAIINMHNKFGFKRPARPEYPDDAMVLMRLNFLLEELKELSLSCGCRLTLASTDEIKIIHEPTFKRNMPDTIDALVDLMVVLLGTADFFGLLTERIANCGITRLNVAWCRVMRANMEKERGRGKRGHDVDLVKPAGWRAPNLEDLA
jgi:predicted HAD superfamily Cof-like phosphohydrolase